jgi:UDP-N-acetylglucosamine--N-acetylmuramyl-(pentapeptide) pyrophosphoryl-undecaprenol N-acetylglucosamine transferase
MSAAAQMKERPEQGPRAPVPADTAGGAAGSGPHSLRGAAPLALIMAGGTGGHVFPALALARELRARAWQIVWLGTRRGLEARVVPAEQIAVEWLSVGGLRGKGPTVWLRAPLSLLRALAQALLVMRRRRPALVVGLGGFASGPGGLAAWLTRRPLLIHEQNAVAGFTNRCLAHLARRVLAAFPGSFRPGVQVRVIGNPVRREILQLPAPAQRFALRERAIRVLVLGGSQGAARLNAIVPFAFARAVSAGTDTATLAPLRFDVRHQAGERWLQSAQQSYAQAGVSARLHAFIEEMSEAYGWADLVICRAGALTISELAAAGVGAVLVPYPAATDDHQTRNAEALVAAGAAVMIAEAALTAERLAEELLRLCAGRGRLLVMAECARALARPRATQELADACVELVVPADQQGGT